MFFFLNISLNDLFIEKMSQFLWVTIFGRDRLYVNASINMVLSLLVKVLSCQENIKLNLSFKMLLLTIYAWNCPAMSVIIFVL